MRKSPVGKSFAIVAGAVFLLIAGSARAQEWRGRARIEGTVKSTTGEPIVGAKVSLRWGESGHGGPDVTTNKSGHWAFFGLAAGSWDIDFDAPGYEPRKINAHFDEGARNPPIDIQLEPSKKTGSHEELQVAGQKISPETAAAVEAGNAALLAKNYAEARTNYLKALQELPDHTPLLMRLAAAYYGEGNNDEALKYAKKVVEKDPQDAAAWRTIAEIELSKGNLDAGREALNKVPAEKITDPTSYLNMGILLYNKKQPAAAEEAFGKALTVNPDLADAYYYRALSRIQLKRIPDAKADLKKYLELAPTGSEADTAKELLKSI